MQSLRTLLQQKIRQVTASLLFQWVLRVRSQPLKVTAKPIMVFSPHQDDETLGCGGLISLKRSQGIPVQVVFLTDGRYGRPDWIAPDDIIQVRKNEALAALDILGVPPANVHFFNQMDGSLATLSDASRGLLVDQLADLLQTHQPAELYVPHHDDNHPDHEASFNLVQAAIVQSQLACDLFQYPIWLFWQDQRSLLFNPKKLVGARRLAIASGQRQKHQAIAVYQSQIPGLTASFLKRFFAPYELFFKQD